MMQRKPTYVRRQNVFKNKRAISGGTKLEVCSWNVEEKCTPVELDKLVTGAMQQQPDVVCLQKAKLPPPNTETDNFKWFCGSGTSGSAILIKKSSNIILNSMEQLSDQICVADLTIKEGVKLNVISCYIPPATDYACSDLWIKLKEIVSSLSPTGMFILAGNFNAQIGKDNLLYTSLCPYEVGVKRLYHETSNENGHKLTELLRKCHLRLFISMKKNGSDLFTFNDGKTKTQESFVILPYIRPTFSGEGYNVWHHKYHHAMIRFQLMYKPFDRVHDEKQVNSLGEQNPVIATWNIQSATPAKVDKVLNEYNLPIVCIQELFLTSDDEIQTENYSWLSSKKLWSKNVGLVVKKCPEITVSSFEPLSEFFCAATVVFQETPLLVISCHLPTVSDPQHEKVLSQMKELIKGLPQDVFTVLGGDFGAVIKNEKYVSNADDYMKQLGDDIKMEVVGGLGLFKKLAYFTQVTETSVQRAHYVLVSQSALKKVYPKLRCRWIPLFDTGIVTFVATPDERSKQFTFESVKAFDNPLVELNEEVTKEDGERKKTVVLNFGPKDGIDVRDDITSLVSANDVEKFKDTPPSAEELGRMLKDFVLMKVANHKSLVVISPFLILVKSLSECKLGSLTVEDITEANGRRICRLRWQGVLLAEEAAPPEDKTTNLRNKAAISVFASICQTCYTIKARKTYFNKGRPPVLMDKPELADVLKKVKKSSFPTLEDVYKLIDEFLNKDSDEELVFGSDFPKRDHLAIAGYTHSKNGLLDFRFFVSNKQRYPPDHLAVFRKRSPQYLRDMLIKNPKNHKYFLIYPCGLGGNYQEFSKRFTADLLKEEISIYQKGSQRTTENVTQVQKPKVGGEGPKGKSPRVSQPSHTLNSGTKKRDFNAMNSNQNGYRQGGPSAGASSVSKKQKLDPTGQRSFKLETPPWSKIRPLVIVWPTTVRSQLEERPEHVISENFTVDFQSSTVNGQNVTAVFVALTNHDGFGRLYCIAKGNTARNASRNALDLLVRHCTVIKPNPNYLCNGRTPNFIRYKVPCQFNPRTYLILDRNETGPLTWKVIEELVERFLNSYEEEMFFDRDSYSFQEKLALVENVPKLAPSKLLVRHFGDDPKLIDRYVCVYKLKPKQDILREVLKMRGQHPKFTMTTNRLPPGIEYNIF